MTTNGTNGWQTTDAGQALQAQLTNERTLMVLTRLLERIDSLEKTVDTLAQAPGMVAVVGDMADEAIGNAAKRGVDVEARLKAGLEMAEKLTAPATMAKFDQLLDLADQAPGMVAMMGDMADEAIGSAAKRGVDVEARLKAGLEMAEKLTAPATMAKFDQLLELADQAPGMVAMVGDMADEAVGNAAKRGVDVEARLKAGITLAEKLTAPEMERALHSLLDPNVVALLNKMGNAVNAGVKAPATKVGAFTLLRQLNDPDLQRALGFLTTVGKQLGKELN